MDAVGHSDDSNNNGNNNNTHRLGHPGTAAELPQQWYTAALWSHSLLCSNIFPLFLDVRGDEVPLFCSAATLKTLDKGPETSARVGMDIKAPAYS